MLTLFFTGLGAAIAHRFARAGYAVAVCSRSKEKLDTISRDINHALQEVKADKSAQGANSSTSTVGGQHRGVVRSFAMDCTDEKSVVDAFVEIRKQFGQRGTLHSSQAFSAVVAIQPQLQLTGGSFCLRARLTTVQVAPFACWCTTQLSASFARRMCCKSARRRSR